VQLAHDRPTSTDVDVDVNVVLMMSENMFEEFQILDQCL
jgi:hypothetical protein